MLSSLLILVRISFWSSFHVLYHLIEIGQFVFPQIFAEDSENIVFLDYSCLFFAQLSIRKHDKGRFFAELGRVLEIGRHAQSIDEKVVNRLEKLQEFRADQDQTYRLHWIVALLE